MVHATIDMAIGMFIERHEDTLRDYGLYIQKNDDTGENEYFIFIPNIYTMIDFLRLKEFKDVSLAKKDDNGIQVLNFYENGR